MTGSTKTFLTLAIFLFLTGCSAPTPETPTLPIALTVAPIVESTPTLEPTSTPQVVENFTFPHISATVYGDAGNFTLQAGVLSTVSWVDAPPAANY